MKTKFTSIFWILAIVAAVFTTKYLVEKSHKKDSKKETSDSNCDANITSENCMDEYYDGFPLLADETTQVEWLRTTFYKVEVSPEACDCAKEHHKITGGIDAFNSYVGAFWGEETPKFDAVTIGKIKQTYFNEAIDYENYISFTYDKTTNKVTYKLTKNFTTSPNCYSLPLFESIYRENKDAVLLFTKAIIQNSELVVFSIEHSNTGFFDYSQIPTVKGTHWAL